MPEIIEFERYATATTALVKDMPQSHLWDGRQSRIQCARANDWLQRERGKAAIQPDERLHSPDQAKDRHMMALLSVSKTDHRLPPLIILNSLSNLPTELCLLKNFRAWWFASAGIGWITPYLFRRCVFLFPQCPVKYRQSPPSNLAAQAIVAAVDGHNSRECQDNFIKRHRGDHAPDSPGPCP
jgi:hypothetical protein